MSDIFLFVVLVFACYRITGLIVLDRGPFKFFAKLRALFGVLASKAKQKGLYFEIAEGVHCVHCVGIWVAFPLAFFLMPESVLMFFVYWVAIAGAQSYLHENYLRESYDIQTPG